MYQLFVDTPSSRLFSLLAIEKGFQHTKASHIWIMYAHVIGVQSLICSWPKTNIWAWCSSGGQSQKSTCTYIGRLLGVGLALSMLEAHQHFNWMWPQQLSNFTGNFSSSTVSPTHKVVWWSCNPHSCNCRPSHAPMCSMKTPTKATMYKVLIQGNRYSEARVEQLLRPAGASNPSTVLV